MKKIILLLVMLPLVVSCWFVGAGFPGIRYIRLLTGECLNSTELSYYLPDGEDQQVYGNSFSFGFTFDLSSKTEKTDMMGWIYRVIPSDEIFETFGDGRKKVRKEYEAFYDLYPVYQPEYFDNDDGIITILYNGGISLIADKEFAGYAAGEELGHLITYVYNPGDEDVILKYGNDPVIACPTNLRDNINPFLNIPLDYISVAEGSGIAFNIPMKNFKLTDEKVTFELKIPVKVVMYLNWLNDKISDPDAPVPYKDEVLHCRFTTRYGLR